ncbi:MAG: hypothetical protein IJ534_04750 [Bacteroidaceae bacterium]|nr:hypothetical protein [Bacteroidaceae bacterium]
MRLFKAKSYPYRTLMSIDQDVEAYPYLRHPNGDKRMYCVSPIHGRSYLIKQNDKGRFVISKGNGLSYTQFSLLNTKEMGDDTWGILLRKDAIRDFTLGNEVASLGIKTNKMEYVLELDHEIQLTTGHVLKPVLLQYNVECPYRISDAPFMDASQIWKQVMKWGKNSDNRYEDAYLIAATVLIRNLRILHDNEILHNAIHMQNYTWALELLDFELACSPSHPYDMADDQRHVKDLFHREIIQTYEIINYIACILQESIDFKKVDNLFKDFGFDLSIY